MCSSTTANGVFGNIRGLNYNDAGVDEDPYVTLENPNQADEELEQQELEILPTDNLLVSAKTSDEVSMLEVHVYEPPGSDSQSAKDGEDDYEGNLYVHHDTLLPAMPLCLEWCDCRPSTSGSNKATRSDKGNFVAVGTMDHQIEVWDLDIVDGLFPEAILGDDTDLKEGEPAETEKVVEDAEPSLANGMQVDDESAADASETPGADKKKRKKKKKKKAAATSPPPTPAPISSPHAHTDSVLSISWNRSHRNLLASSSADGTIKLWDLSTSSCQRALRSFEGLFPNANKIIASIAWNPHPSNATILLAGGWGGEVIVFDTRSPEKKLVFSLPDKSDTEVVKWDSHSHDCMAFFVSTSSGKVYYFDAAKATPGGANKPTWTLDAHKGSVSGLDISPFVPGLLVTGGVDKLIKVWNFSASPAGKTTISLVVSRDFSLGKLFCCSLSPDDPTVLAMAGSACKLQVWDLWTNAGFRKVFGERVRNAMQGNEVDFQEGGRREKAKGIIEANIDGDEGEASDDE